MDGSHATLLAALLLLGCGGTAAAPATAGTPDALAGPPRPWAELGPDERRQHMVHEVLPRASAMFAEHDPQRYADFSCATCHGPDAQARGFAMPNPSLYPLSPTGSARQHQTVRDHPEMVRFMYGRLVPAMETMLGAQRYDEATGEGFTCYACHPHAEPDGPTTQPVAD